MTINRDAFELLAICAIRYCHGRQSYMPDRIQKIVIEHLPDISDERLQILINDCDFQKRMDMYGDPLIDKPGWIEYSNALIEEQNKR